MPDRSTVTRWIIANAHAYRRRRPAELRRRVVLGGLLAAVASPALAQDGGSWLDSAFGKRAGSTPRFGEPGYVDRQRWAPEPPGAELRGDSIPMLSEETRQSLEGAFGQYQNILSRGGWPKVPQDRTLRPGDQDDRVEALIRRLMVTGDYRPRGQRTGSGYFDPEVEQAVKLFQQRHGIRPTGVVDRATLTALNVPADMRVAQLRLNQQRLRELMGQQPADRYVLVNIPAQALESVEGGQVLGRHRTIVGKPDRQTPGLRATIRNVNFLPAWHVPDSVARLDLVPRLQKDPTYLEKEHIRVLQSYKGEEIPRHLLDWRDPSVLNYKFRQDPGPWNALGVVRLDMPNEHTVYMHDTPMKNLFGQRQRYYSAGCVRVEGVLDLAGWLLRDVPGWDRQRVEETVQAAIPTDVAMPRPVTVFFAYLTAWADPKGRVDFRPDIYNRDGIAEQIAGHTPEGAVPPPVTLAP